MQNLHSLPVAATEGHTESEHDLSCHGFANTESFPWLQFQGSRKWSDLVILVRAPW